MLSWTSANAVSGSISGVGAVGPSGSMTAWPPQTQTYVGTFAGADGRVVTCTATITVTTPPPPVVPAGQISLSPNPAAVCPITNTAVLTVRANANVDYMIFLRQTGDLFAHKGANQELNKPTNNWVTDGMIFDLVDAYTGALLASVTADFFCDTPPPPPPPPQAPVCTLTANPTSIQTGQSATLTWTSSGATSGSLGGSGTIGLSGSMSVSPSQTTTYTATFNGQGGTVNCQATVTVTQAPPPPVNQPTCVINASPTVITQQGQNITLNWDAQNATIGSITNIGSVGPSGSQSVTPTQSTSYNGTFTGPGGSTNCSVTIIVNINATPQPTCTLTANPSSIQSGGAVTLTWTSQNATGGSINNGVGTLSNPSGSVTVHPTQSVTYVATFTGEGGSVNCQASVTVNNVPPPPPPASAPTCVINASPTVITQQGQNLTINWNAQNATIGSITNIGSVGPSGSQIIYPTQSGEYTATFTGPGGSVNCTANVTVNVNTPPQNNAPACTLSVSNTNVRAGDRVTITWTSTNATTGSITNIGSVSTNGSQSLYPNQSTAYTGTFSGANGTVNCYATVNVTPVNPTYNAPSCTLTANPTNVNSGRSVTLNWDSRNANYGTITHIGSVSTYGSRTVYPTQSTVYQGTFSGSGGSVNCFVTVNVNQAYVPPPVTQPPYISLSQAPYTGLDLGPWGTAAYWTFLVAWCGFAAYLVGVKRVQNKLFDYVMSGYYGTTTLTPRVAGLGYGASEPVSEEPTYWSTPDTAVYSASYTQPQADATDNFVISQIKR